MKSLVLFTIGLFSQNNKILILREAEEGFEVFFGDVAADFGDGLGEGDFFWADLDAVLGVAAFADATFAHEGVEAFALEGFPGGVGVEEFGLVDRGGADEV